MSDEEKKNIRMNVIYEALRNGWSVRKSDVGDSTFEFTKNQVPIRPMTDDNKQGLIIFTKKTSLLDEIKQHFENINTIKNSKNNKLRKSVSTPQ